jgi:hypothetical protein
MDKAGLAQLLAGREHEAIVRTLAMMAYIPAIGRVLKKGGVVRFVDLMNELVPNLYTAQRTRDDFDAWHAAACRRIVEKFKTARDRTLLYGQAQKPLNVFLKVYVDWAKQPTDELAEKLIPWLHVPLDSVVMRFVKREFEREYGDRVAVVRQQRIERTSERLRALAASSTRTVARQLVGAEFSLAAIDKETYLAWQGLLRDLWPGKPVQLDIIWVLERRPLPATADDEPE